MSIDTAPAHLQRHDKSSLMRLQAIPGLPTGAFIFRKTNGQPVQVSDMSTVHIFNTAMKIWNVTAPAGAEVGTVPSFNQFDANYSRDYLLASLMAMLAEIGRRPDITGWQLDDLSQVADHITRAGGIGGIGAAA